MYVNILDFSPDGNATLLLYNHYTAPGSNVLDWYVEGTVQGDPGREYLYMIVSTEALSYEYLESVASNPREYEPEEHIYATDIESFQVVPGTGVRTGMPAYNPFVEIQGTPLEVYPTYYIFPRDDRYRNPYFYYYYYVPGGRQGGGKYYRSRVGIGGKNYYAYPQGGISFGNLTGLHTTGHIIDDRWRVIPGTFLSGTFRLGTVPNPIGMVLHPYMPGGFYRSYEDWGNELTFDVWLNNEKQVQGYVVNEEYGNPVIFVPVEGANLVDGENKFEIRVPIEGQTVDIERIEIVESDLPEEVDTGAPN
jgi:hypothetical protein